MDLCAVVLCGGKSTRMGTNKSLLELNNRPVIEHIIKEFRKITDRIIIITNDKETYQNLNVPLYSDRFKEAGPLAGIESAMYHVAADQYIFAACDMPFINKDVYEYLLQSSDAYEAVVPKYNGRLHPLASIYKRTSLPIIQQKLEHGDYRVRSFYDDIQINYVSDFSNLDEDLLQRHFFNMNHPEEYEKAKHIAKDL